MPASQLCLNLLNYSPAFTDGLDLDIDEQAAGAAEAGFSNIGIDLWSVIASLERGGTLGALRRRFDQLSLTPFEMVGFGATSDVDATVASAQQSARAVGELGVRYVLVFFHEQLTDDVRRALDRAVSMISREGALVACEFMPDSGLATLADARMLLREHGDSARLVLDSWHFFRGGAEWADLESLPLAELAYVQLNDGLLSAVDDGSDILHGRLMPGDGEFDLTRFCGTLRARGYDGVVSVEVLSRPMRSLPAVDFARLAWQRTCPYL